jgi:hypothetical protein
MCLRIPPTYLTHTFWHAPVVILFLSPFVPCFQRSQRLTLNSFFLVGRDKLGWVAASQPTEITNHPVISTALGKRKRSSTTSAGAPEPDEPALPPATEQATTDVFERSRAPLAKRRLTLGQLAAFRRDPPSLVNKSFLCHLPGAADGGPGDGGSGPSAEQRDNELFFEVVGYMTRPSYVMCVLFEGSNTPNQLTVKGTMELVENSQLVVDH